MSVGATDLAYTAALVDMHGALTVRAVRGTELPQITIQGKFAVLPWLAEITGVKIIEVIKGYSKHQCSDHCPDRHMEIQSVSYRWQLTGTRAVVVLHNIEPFLRQAGPAARRLIDTGLSNGYQTTVANDMHARGWELPTLREQPRARVSLITS